MPRGEAPRPGGRSARIQASVHKAARDLLAAVSRADVTVPAIAERAGVPPSTIYRRWGGLPDLLADLAAEHLRPDTEPVDTGHGRGDLLAWTEQYTEEMSSAPGRAMIRDVLRAQDRAAAVQCCGYTARQIAVIAERARARGEAFPSVDAVVDGIIAPILYRILFQEAPDAARVGEFIDRVYRASSASAAVRLDP